MNAAKDIFQRAEQAARKGNLEYSIELYLQGLTINPKASDERQTLHRIEAQLVESNGGNPAGGVGAKLKSAGKIANLKKLKVQKKWDEAILEIENILKIQPHNTPLLFDLAEMLEHIEAPKSAIAILSDLTDIDKTHVESYRKLGSLWEGEGEPKKAIEAWDTHFGRLESVRLAAEAEAAADDSIDLDLSQALSSINPDLDTWKENTVWTSEKVATTLEEQDKDALGDEAEWTEEQ